MAFTKDNVLVLYRSGDADSIAFALYYRNAHGLSDDQLVSLPCSADEILSSYAEFVTQIESPLQEFISTSTVDIMGIVVGYNMPGGFIDGGDIIATTSRLARMDYIYSKQEGNPLYGRPVFETYDDYNARLVYICSRIDAPTLQAAQSIVDNAVKVTRRTMVTGEFFFDPYAPLINAEENEYLDELLSFGDIILPLLNLPIFTTKFWDEYTDVVVPRLISDSFMWSWKSDRAGFTFFENTTTSRVFLYNADTDGASTLKDYTQRLFPMLATASGYAATAGAMSDPTANGHLRPLYFFDALMRGGTIGEAFVNACPFFDWTVSLIGDPLVTIRFPNGSATLSNSSVNANFEATQDNLASAIAYMIRKESDLTNAVNDILSFTDVDKIPILTALQQAANDQSGTWQSQMVIVVNSFIAFWTGGTPSAFDSFLTAYNTKVSRLIPLISGETIVSAANQYVQGAWKIESPLQAPTSDFVYYHITLQVASDPNFNYLIGEYSSDPNSEYYSPNFSYEQMAGVFSPYPAKGVSSSYAGRRIRFDSDASQYMAAGTIYYWQVSQTSVSDPPTPFVSSKAIINT